MGCFSPIRFEGTLADGRWVECSRAGAPLPLRSPSPLLHPCHSEDRFRTIFSSYFISWAVLCRRRVAWVVEGAGRAPCTGSAAARRDGRVPFTQAAADRPASGRPVKGTHHTTIDPTSSAKADASAAGRAEGILSCAHCRVTLVGCTAGRTAGPSVDWCSARPRGDCGESHAPPVTVGEGGRLVCSSLRCNVVATW